MHNLSEPAIRKKLLLLYAQNSEERELRMSS